MLINNPEGIKEDENLKVCYRGLEEDLQDLKNDGWVRVIKYQRDKEIVLYPINKNEKNVEVRDKISSKSASLLTEVWDKDVSVLHIYQIQLNLLTLQ